MKFTKIHTPKKSGEGHKLFRNEKNQLVLADWSGSTPDRTDDGPLYPVAFSTVKVTIEYGTPTFHIPVKDEAGGDFFVLTSLETVQALQEHGARFEFKASGPLHDFVSFMADKCTVRS